MQNGAGMNDLKTVKLRNELILWKDGQIHNNSHLRKVTNIQTLIIGNDKIIDFGILSIDLTTIPYNWALNWKEQSHILSYTRLKINSR